MGEGSGYQAEYFGAVTGLLKTVSRRTAGESRIKASNGIMY